MILHFLENNGHVSYSNWPIKENGVSSIKADIPNEWLELVESGEKDFKITNESVSIEDSTRKSEKEAAILEMQDLAEQVKLEKLALVEKITKGEATKEEQQQFVNLL